MQLLTNQEPTALEDERHQLFAGSGMNTAISSYRSLFAVARQHTGRAWAAR
jgi:hypothetical protein